MIENVPIGPYVLRVNRMESRAKETDIAIGSSGQTINLTVLLMPRGPAVAGCVPDFEQYQSDLADFLSKNPAAISFQIDELTGPDSVSFGSVAVTVTNNTQFDLYIPKDYPNRGEMYIAKLLDSGGGAAKCRTVTDILVGVEFVHKASDIRRVPSKQKIVVDTVSIWQYARPCLPVGEYSLQLVYVFPESRELKDDEQFRLFSPVSGEQEIGELYCMVLRGRFESNILPVHLK